MGEKSFIPRVLQKESELEALLHSAKEESDRIIDSAKYEAQKYIREFEKKLPDIVRERYEADLKRARNEARHIQDAGQVQAEILKKKAMESLGGAVEEIMQAVLPAPLPHKEGSDDIENE